MSWRPSNSHSFDHEAELCQHYPRLWLEAMQAVQWHAYLLIGGGDSDHLTCAALHCRGFCLQKLFSLTQGAGDYRLSDRRHAIARSREMHDDITAGRIGSGNRHALACERMQGTDYRLLDIVTRDR